MKGLEPTQLAQDGAQRGRIAHHLVGDARQLGDEGWDRALGIDQGRPLAFGPPAIKTNRPDLEDGVALGVETGGLYIDGYN